MQLGGFIPLNRFDIMKENKPKKGAAKSMVEETNQNKALLKSRKGSLTFLFPKTFYLTSLTKKFNHLLLQE